MMISNTNSLKEFIESETVKVKKKLRLILPTVSDKVTKIKSVVVIRLNI